MSDNPVIDSFACTFDVEPNRIVANLHRRWVSTIGSYCMIVLGLSPTFIGMPLIFFGQSDDMPSLPGFLVLVLMGLLHVAIAWACLRVLRHEWGTVVIDRDTGTITWHRGDDEVGRWSVADVKEVQTRWNWNNNFRFALGRFGFAYFERILYVKLSDDTRVRIAVGWLDELDEVRGHLRDLGVPA